jgi:glutaredoxin 3
MIGRWFRRLKPPSRPKAPMYQPSKVRLFTKPYCSWCHRAIHWLDDHDIQYEVLDVISNEEAYEEMYRLSGQVLAPVIEVDGQVLADFGPDQLERFWRGLGQTK